MNETSGNSEETPGSLFCAGDEPKSELARDQGVILQSRDAASDDLF